METLTDAIELYRPLSTAPLVVHEEASETLKWGTSKAVITEWKKQVGVTERELFYRSSISIRSRCHKGGLSRERQRAFYAHTCSGGGEAPRRGT